MNAVRLRHPFDDVLVVGAWRATAAERAKALTRSHALFRIRALRAGTLDLNTLADLHALAFQQSIASPRVETADLLRRRIEEAVERGLLLVVERERRQIVVQLAVDPGNEPLGPLPEQQDVEFDFEYADGTPVSGLRDVLVDSGGTKQKGILGDDGVVQRKDAAGSYAVSLAGIDLVEWDRRRANAGQEVTLVARTSGIDDGAAMTVRIYRLWNEEPAHAIATLTLAVQQGAAQGAWKYVPKAPDESGVASFVAEASLEGGQIWRKSAPIQLDLPVVTAASWSQPRVAPGDAVDLVVQARGFPDGAEVAITLFRHSVDQGDKKVGDLAPPPPLRGRSTLATLRCDDVALPASPGDVYAKVTVKKDGVERTAYSPLLWIDAARADVA